MSGGDNASCPLVEGQCVKEHASQSATHAHAGPIDPDEPLIRFVRVKEVYATGENLKPLFLNPREIFEGTDNGWSFLRERMISDDARLRELARITRGGQQRVYGYVRTSACELKALAARQLAALGVLDGDKALGVIHDGTSNDVPEHVAVENCVSLSTQQTVRLCEYLAKHLKEICKI